VLYIHLHADAVAAHGPGAVARVEGGGPEAATAEQVMAWLGRTDMRVQPVRDLADTVAVDAYEAPASVQEIVVLRNPCCPFPWCNNLTRNKDIDHIRSHVPLAEGGPPGQTAPDKLAAPCRRHHRLKTHGGWSYVMPEPGIYLWRSPMGQRYLVDHTGTTNLTTPTAPPDPAEADPAAAEPGKASTRGADPGEADPGRADPGGADPGGAGPAGPAPADPAADGQLLLIPA